MLKKLSVIFNEVAIMVYKITETLSAIILFSMFIIVASEILLRNFYSISLGWVIELSQFGLVIVVFLSANLLFHHDEHISIIIFHNYVTPKTLNKIKIFLDIIILYFLYINTIYSYRFALTGRNTWSLMRTMQMYYPRLVILIAFIAMGVQVFNNLLKRILKLKNLN